MNLNLQQFSLPQLLSVLAAYLKSLRDDIPDDSEAADLWAVLQEIEMRRRLESMEDFES